ncbi:MAG TPA: ankyrin repeat domain-containing protein, partial [Chlamydiales bacterium]|nr:ankyrin repeat domain-containing protein [Chlamydiales bacterium]
MTPLNGTTIPTLYDHWTCFCNNPLDQIVHTEQTLIVGSACKTIIRYPTDCSSGLENLVVFGNAILAPDDTSRSHEFHVTNIYVLGGKVNCQKVSVIANRIIQLTIPQFARALSTLFAQKNTFKPIGPRKQETPPTRFNTNVFQITTETPLEMLHAYRGLGTAAKHGEEDYVKLFIAAKANINEGTQPPITLAAERNHVEVVDLLIKANASLEKEDLTGSTPLICAAASNAVGAAQLLLAAKANVNATNFGDQTPLDAALDSSSLEMLNLLHDTGVDLNTTPPDAESMSAAVMHAVGNGLVQKLSDLIAQGFNIKAPNDNKDTPLMLAAKYGQDQIVALLLANCADTEIRGNEGTALDLAVSYNFPKVIQLLIADDPDTAIKFLMTHKHPGQIAKKFFQLIPNAIAFGRQALKEAVRTSNAKAANALLAVGVGVSGDPSNQEEKAFGEEILLCAVFSANFEIVSLLIQAKANFHIVDSHGSTLLMQVRLLKNGLSSPQSAVDLRPERFRTRSAN